MLEILTQFVQQLPIRAAQVMVVHQSVAAHRSISTTSLRSMGGLLVRGISGLRWTTVRKGALQATRRGNTRRNKDIVISDVDENLGAGNSVLSVELGPGITASLEYDIYNTNYWLSTPIL